MVGPEEHQPGDRGRAKPTGGSGEDRWVQEREALVSERDELVRQLGTTSAHTAQLEARVAQLEQEGESVRDRVREIALERDALRREIAALDQDRMESEGDGHDVAARAEELERERAQLRQEREELERHSAEHAQDRAAESGELASARAVAAQLELRLKDLDEQHEFDQRRIAAHSSERQRLSEHAAEAERHVERLEAELTSQEGKLAKLQQARDELEQRVERQRARLQDLDERSARRRDRIQDMEARLAHRNDQLTDLRAQVEAVHAELKSLRARAAANTASLTQERQALANEIDHLLRVRRELANRVESQQRELAASHQEREEAMAAFEVSERRADDLDSLRARIAEELSEQSTHARELGQRLSAREAELGAVRTHAEELRGAIGSLRERAEAAEQSLTSTVEERRSLIAHLARVQNELLERDERLDKLIQSRWYQLASASWRVRRRPVLLLAGLGPLVLVVGAFVALALVGAPWPAFAGLGLVTVIAAALIGRRVLRGLRRRPRRRRKSAAVALDEGREIAPAPRDAATPVAADLESPAAGDAPVTLPPQPVARIVQVGSGPKLVPVPLGAAIDREREEFLLGSRQVDPRKLRVAGVLDEMSRACFGPECDLFCEFTMEDWEEQLTARPPHLLLVESAWSGNSGGWQYGVASYPHPHYAGLPKLRALLEWCRERGIPTLFWNKEDPVHFERFKEAAALFDHILTSDSNCIPAYEALQGEHVRTISALPFAAQPRLHNPIAIVDERRTEPVFAGTYYRNRHVDRRESLEMILDAARPFGLIIYDRTYGADSDEFGFPERFQPHIAGRLPYDQVIDVYKRHRVFVNVNSVTDSPTMFSRRVFELLACGTAVVSTESVGIEEMFGDLVPVVGTLEEATATIEKLLYDDPYFAKVTRRARRLVLSEHTYRRRLAQIAKTAGFDVSGEAGQEVAVIALADSSEALGPTAEAILDQNMRPREVIIGTSAPDEIAGEVERLTERFGAERVRACTQDPAQEAEDRYRELGRLAATPWVAPMGDGAMYTADHLRDLVACIDFADAQAIGTAPIGDDASPVQHRYVDALQPLTAIVARDVVAAHGWANEPAGVAHLFDRGVRFYAGDGSALTRVQSQPEVSGNGSSRRRLRRR
jgi:septal ring factor EnvC (AmiA/AmiB activator)/glycosyltransferase involved in cell wall biosynthesis